MANGKWQTAIGLWRQSVKRKAVWKGVSCVNSPTWYPIAMSYRGSYGIANQFWVQWPWAKFLLSSCEFKVFNSQLAELWKSTYKNYVNCHKKTAPKGRGDREKEKWNLIKSAWPTKRISITGRQLANKQIAKNNSRHWEKFQQRNKRSWNFDEIKCCLPNAVESGRVLCNIRKATRKGGGEDEGLLALSALPAFAQYLHFEALPAES